MKAFQLQGVSHILERSVLRLLLLFGCVPGFQAVASDASLIPTAKLDTDVRLVSKLDVPIGDIVTVQGAVVAGTNKSDDDHWLLKPQRINGTATQKNVKIGLRPYVGDWTDDTPQRLLGLPKFDEGTSYEFEGYVTGGYVGKPPNARKQVKLRIGSPEFHFHEAFVV